MKSSLFFAELTATIILPKTIIITIYANEKESRESDLAQNSDADI